MKPCFAILCIFFLANNSKAQIITTITWVEKSNMNETDIIYYNGSKKLAWNDFRGTPNLPNPVAAITSSGFGYKAGMRSENRKGQINVDVYCYFSKSKSWVKESRNTDYILNHEQHHFDATYIAAKIFFEKVKTTKLTIINMNAKLAALYKECCNMMNNMQTQYDKETKNGQHKMQQEKWNNFFDEKLLLLTA